MKTISFVIPCYRSAKTIGGVVDEIIKTVTDDGRFDYEIICVNDHSPDDTLAVLLRLAENPRVKVIDLMRNFGQHSALMAGYNFAVGDYVVSLDDDGQNPPSEVFKLIDKLIEGDHDWVSGKYSKKRESAFRRFGSRLAKKMSQTLIDAPKDVDINSFCVIRREIAEEIVKYKNAYPFVHGLMLRVTRNVADVEIEHRPRAEGRSGYNLAKLVRLTLNGFTAFSVKPLRIAALLGVLAALAGFVFGIAVVIRKILFPDILLGYSSLMAVLLFLGGMIMMLLGLLGEYVGRIYICINNAPQFAIRSIMNFTEQNLEHVKLLRGEEAEFIWQRSKPAVRE